ncbi:unnamed protein product [Notodromas monacha]|uniref:chitin synthase n=1 Tax=Notodromas monacha TaxID=399045 RepID=A0A7R9BPE3_9CRUS|nr:unnamed protein product [Notodromas monacha]CAG0919230.1 unnamed protein product [Notodromas monacha]
MKKTRYFTYIFISLWKILFFFGSMLLLLYAGSDDSPIFLFKSFKDSFSTHALNVTEVNGNLNSYGTPDIDVQPFVEPVSVNSWGGTAAYVLLIQVLAAWLCYVFAKFACKICIQGFSFAFPVSLTVPVTISFLIALCGLRNDDSCLMENIVPAYLYWKCPQGDFLNEFISNQYAWIWLLWLLSQTWVTLHIWTPKCERLATTEKLFVTPMYCSLIIDQSLAMNRRMEEDGDMKTEDIPGIDDGGEEMSPYYETISVCTNSSGTEPSKKTKSSDHITRIYACATMWHETRDEMMEMLKSIFRMDEDQSARRVAQKYLKVVDPDYYEFEKNANISIVQHQTNIRIKPPKKYPAPYGGRLVWTLPGRTKIICHLKNKDKIRTRKRWSQVMYMYYLLGHRLMELPISEERKSTIAENTYLLTLDGDIDFQPGAVQLLVDLMKKNRKLGAACGRIHPVGSGPMVWYQMFEYAIGHWLQKATEHMIGCVMCSPGCFSIFRGIALMDDNVMGKYTTRSDEARHYVQYDQGEDRWLCTLLLQRGYRVEYSAASDAYTHCPEGFSEFYNQRRRWVPSTMANIMDLLMDYKLTIKVNDSISFPYIVYQFMLMMGTILGPGTIFLMLVGAFVAAFRIDNWTSFTANLIFAQIMSAGYALVMMAVIVGTALQLGEDGIGSPSAIFLIALSGSFFIAACLHPQEFWCIVPGLLYLLLIPSMYLLLIIYGLVNLNNVSWGTREVLTKKTKAELERDKKEAEEAQKKHRQKALLGILNKGNGSEDEGSIEFSLAGLFKCMCCLYPKPIDEGQQLMKIADSLMTITKRLDTIEKVVDPHGQVVGRRRSFSRNSTRGHNDPLGTVAENDQEEDNFDDNLTDTESDRLAEPKIERDEMINPYWLEDSALRRAEYDTLPGPEVQFWNELIEKYLFPIDADKEKQKVIGGQLKELRNRSVFYFFMCNAIFILIVFLLQLNKDNLHFKWPFGEKTNVTLLSEEGAQPIVTKEYLQLEPIGLVFVFFFALILIIQFTAMLFHRFGTLSHILASTELTCCNKKVDDSVLDIEKSAVQIVKELQKLRDIDEDESEDGSDRTLGRRRTIHQLEKHRRHRHRQIGTLDVAFRKRFFAISNAGEGNDPESGAHVPGNMRKLSSMRRETIKALDLRRKTVMGEKAERKQKMETLGAKRGEVMKARMAEAAAAAGYHNGSTNGGVANRGYESENNEHPGSVRLQNLLNPPIIRSDLP